MGLLTQRVHDRLDVLPWKFLRDFFVRVSEVILEISPEAQGELAGNYVKFSTASGATSPVYAAVWPKMSLPKRLIVGLALPEDFEAAGLGPPPERIFYQGFTKFLVIKEEQTVPQELSTWARLAYDAATH